MKRVFFFALLALVACSTDPQSKYPPPKPYNALNPVIGPWTNIYEGDPNLAAVAVFQYGESPYDNHRFTGKHPCNIWYAFWDGSVRQIQYEPDGRAFDDFWWPEDMKLTPGSSGWSSFDFKYGSDPEFKRHKDPRKA